MAGEKPKPFSVVLLPSMWAAVKAACEPLESASAFVREAIRCELDRRAKKGSTV